VKDKAGLFSSAVDAFLLGGILIFLFVYFDIRYLCLDTVVTGGDTASWHGVADHLKGVLLPTGRVTGWDMGNFCGYPNFTFYFLPPFLLAALASLCFGLPLTIALKWAIMSGIFLFPAAVYWGLREMDYKFPLPIVGAAATLAFLFNESYTMFGGNTLSTFAGEFCYMFALAVLFPFVGSFHKGLGTGARTIVNGTLLGCIGLSHLFVFVPATALLVYGALWKGKMRYAFKVGLVAFAWMAFWILPLISHRHPYTTPVYMIWQPFADMRHTMAGVLLVLLCVGPRFTLDLAAGAQGPVGRRSRLLGVFSGLTTFAAVYLVLRYLVLGEDLWYTGLTVPDPPNSPLGVATALLLDPWSLPAAVAIGVVVTLLTARLGGSGPAPFKRLCRAAGCLSFLALLCIGLLALYRAGLRSGAPEAVWNAPWTRWIPGPACALASLGLGAVLLYSQAFGRALDAVASRVHPGRFRLWCALGAGCVVAYFSAHFLKVPDIRFLPPLAYILILIVSVETVGPFLLRTGPFAKSLAALTVVYLSFLLIVFGAGRSYQWFLFNNKGYEATPGFSEFEAAARYLRGAYAREGIDPLNAPRVAYEKCDLYGPYGGDRAFESLPYFSGRQTLEGIHYASSLGSRAIAFVQSAFSRDIKSPEPLVFSRMDTENLPPRLDLYNVSQLLVKTDEARKALDRSDFFEREARFGDLFLFRYKGCSGRYVEVPKVRPALLAGERWADAFYAWFKDPARLQVLLVPESFVKDEKDRAVFAGSIRSQDDLKRFEADSLDPGGLYVETHLEPMRIRFTTNRVGWPHLVKVSYFPNWRVKGANGVYPVSPHLMLVVPRENEVVLTYGRSGWEVCGFLVTAGWIVCLLTRPFLATAVERSRPHLALGSLLESMGGLWAGRPILRSGAMALTLLAASGLVLGGLVCRNKPVRTLIKGNRFYQGAAALAGQGKSLEAARGFEEALAVMEPLLEQRFRYDHRDVVHCLLLAAACRENLGQDERALAWYRVLLGQYPYSRFVAEGHVRTARVLRRQMEAVWAMGMETLRLGQGAAGERLCLEALDKGEEALHHYHQALSDDPYSVWSRYARDDLVSLGEVLDRAAEAIKRLPGDPQPPHDMELLGDRLGRMAAACRQTP